MKKRRKEDEDEDEEQEQEQEQEDLPCHSITLLVSYCEGILSDIHLRSRVFLHKDFGGNDVRFPGKGRESGERKRFRGEERRGEERRGEERRGEERRGKNKIIYLDKESCLCLVSSKLESLEEEQEVGCSCSPFFLFHLLHLLRLLYLYLPFLFLLLVLVSLFSPSFQLLLLCLSYVSSQLEV
jgi:hypothetical protein